MTARIDPEKRRKIADAIRAGAGWRARNDIAREFGVANRTVSKIAADEGITDAFDRTLTAKATAAKQQDNRARRAELSQILLEDSFKIRARMWQPALTPVPGGKTFTAELPIARDLRDFAASMQANLRSHMDLEAFDTGDQGVADAKSMLVGVAEGLRAIAATRLMEEPEEPASED